MCYEEIRIRALRTISITGPGCSPVSVAAPIRQPIPSPPSLEGEGGKQRQTKARPPHVENPTGEKGQCPRCYQ